MADNGCSFAQTAKLRKSIIFKIIILLQMVYCDDLIIANRTEALIRKMFENQSTENVIDLNLRESNLEIFTKDDAKKINELFPKLIYLDISANNLKKLDDEIGILVDLELLFINDNQLNELPSGIKTLKIYQDL